jgi:hypothetical protein
MLGTQILVVLHDLRDDKLAHYESCHERGSEQYQPENPTK